MLSPPDISNVIHIIQKLYSVHSILRHFCVCQRSLSSIVFVKGLDRVKASPICSDMTKHLESHRQGKTIFVTKEILQSMSRSFHTPFPTSRTWPLMNLVIKKASNNACPVTTHIPNITRRHCSHIL